MNWFPSVITALVAMAFMVAIGSIYLSVSKADAMLPGLRRPRGRRYLDLNPFSDNRRLMHKLFEPNVARVLSRLSPHVLMVDVSNTNVSDLSMLHSGIRRVIAQNCPNLRQVTTLPDTVEDADFSRCENLVALPEQLPSRMRKLYLAGTAIEGIESLPPQMVELDARGCDNLRRTPQTWPKSLTWLNLCRTPAAQSVSGDLPDYMLEGVRKRGVAGSRTNTLTGGVMYADPAARSEFPGLPALPPPPPPIY
jgi:hypothetical protein